jgi:DNA repair protein RadC
MATKELKSWRKVKVTLVRETAAEPYTMRSGTDVAHLVRTFVANDPREMMVAVYVDARNKPLAVYQVSIGTAEATLISPREVFCPAVALAASAVLIAHNHPSGNPTPSAEDRAVTDRIRAAGELLGIPLLDHIVIGTARYYSFAEEGFFAYRT